MIPHRYSSITHALRLILQEEGLKGIYKGFLGSLVCSGLYVSLLANISPQIAQAL
jgi:hypothetical protein